MKKISAAAVFVLAVTIGAFLLSASASAQQATHPSSTTVAQDQAPPQENPAPAKETRTFTGTIVKSGDKLVLTDADGKTVYQLDDQIKAREFLNKNVKVTGILDASTSMIRVSAIEPV